MVNKKQNNQNIDESEIEITNEDESLDINDELEDIVAEENQKDMIKSLRDKLKITEVEKRTALEDLQRAKADFLNARKRLEEERRRDRERSIISHIEELIPLCDSFEMAMSNKEVWEKTDSVWRKGVEGIYAQLQGLIINNQVQSLDPKGEVFNPYEHEALSTTPVADATLHDTIVNVIQKGYQLKKADGTTELIRPARVVIGSFEN